MAPFNSGIPIGKGQLPHEGMTVTEYLQSHKSTSFFVDLLLETDVFYTLDHLASVTLFVPNNTCLRSLPMPWTEVLHHPSDLDAKRDFITSFITYGQIKVIDMVHQIDSSPDNHAQWDTVSGRFIAARLDNSNLIVKGRADLVMELGATDVALNRAVVHVVERCSSVISA